MEELKTLIAAVAGLPTLTLWVLVGYLIYKLAVIGSIYGVVWLAIEKLHNVMITRKTKTENVEMYGTIHGICITKDSSHIALLGQLERLRGKGTGLGAGGYIHSQSVQWLREAIDAKEIEDAKKAAAK